MNFIGEAKRLESLDISQLAHEIGCGEDHLHAVMEVETRGGGFFSDGSIKMLPEPHVFYRELGPGAKRDRAVKEGLAYKRWGTKPYPKSAKARYAKLEAMIEIDGRAALASCSWGLGQIMGFNYKLAGYPSPEKMVSDFVNDEDTHLAAMVSFIVSSGLDDELRRLDWRGFARGYNGAGYEKNAYHTKLAKAYAKWQAIPDTPFHIDRKEQDPNPAPVKASHMGDRPSIYFGMRNSPFVADAQETLAGMGYHIGNVDGHFGAATKKGVMAFQSDMGLDTDGAIGPVTWAALYEASVAGHKAPVGEARANATIADVRAAGSTTIKAADEAQAGAGLGLAGTLIKLATEATAEGGTVDQLNGLKGTAEAILGEGFLSTWAAWAMQNWIYLLVAVVFVYVMSKAQKKKEARVLEHQTASNLAR